MNPINPRFSAFILILYLYCLILERRLLETKANALFITRLPMGTDVEGLLAAEG